MKLKQSLRWLVGVILFGCAMDLYGQTPSKDNAGFGAGSGSGFGSQLSSGSASAMGGAPGMGLARGKWPNGMEGAMGGGMGGPVEMPPMKIEINGQEFEATELYRISYRHGSYMLDEYVPMASGYAGMGSGDGGMGMGGYGSMGSGGGDMGMAGGGGSGMGMGMSGGSGMSGGGEGYGSSMGMGITSVFYLFGKANAKQWQRPEVELIFAEKTMTKGTGGGPKWTYYRFRDQLKDKLPAKEIEMVEKLATQKVWSDSIFRSLGQLKSLDGIPPALEPQLRELLGEQYETQLLRQSLEADGIEVRLKNLRQEIERRRVAKDRVIDVQAGRLLLDAQGLLNEK